MSRYKTAAGIALLIFLASCGWEGEGTVVDKQYTEEYEIDGVDTCRTTNGVTTCTDDDIEIPESWELEIKDSAGEKHWVSVSEREWNATTVGDFYSTAN